MCVEQVAQKITARTSAIIVVHIYGLPVDMQPVLEIAQEYGLKILEDGYNRKLSDVPGIRAQPERMEFAENIYWVYGVVLDDEVPFDADEAMQRLAELGVETRPFFWPMHEQPVLRKMNLFDGESYPVAERLARRGFYLPSGMALTEHQIDTVVAAMRKILQ
jgi:perosamine synthetase